MGFRSFSLHTSQYCQTLKNADASPFKNNFEISGNTVSIQKKHININVHLNELISKDQPEQTWLGQDVEQKPVPQKPLAVSFTIIILPHKFDWL